MHVAIKGFMYEGKVFTSGDQFDVKSTKKDIEGLMKQGFIKEVEDAQTEEAFQDNGEPPTE